MCMRSVHVFIQQIFVVDAVLYLDQNMEKPLRCCCWFVTKTTGQLLTQRVPSSLAGHVIFKIDTQVFESSHAGYFFEEES